MSIVGSLKTSVLIVLYYSGIWHILLHLERLLPQSRSHAVVLVYHRVSSQPTGMELSEVERGTALRHLDMHLRLFRRWYHPMSAAEFVRSANEPSAFKDAFVVTFDDGYLDNRYVAGPCIRKHGACGLVFLATDYTSGCARFWWIRLNDLLMSIRPEQEQAVMQVLTGRFGILHDNSLATIEGRKRIRRLIAPTLELMPHEEQADVLDELERLVPPAQATCLPLLSWDEAAAMLTEGFEFGAHTASHPRMTQVPSEQLRSDVDRCIATMTERLADRPTTFAYPYGDCDQRVMNVVRETGIRAAFTVRPGLFRPGCTDMMRIPRIPPFWTQPFELLPVIVLFKFTKYFPGLTRRLLSRAFNSPFEM
jgi:peptidoglycan/xylan/chitin deacetylase (PgdA/CDA1 family)